MHNKHKQRSTRLDRKQETRERTSIIVIEEAAARYIQYAVHTVLVEMMQIVQRGIKGKRERFFGGTKKTTSQVDIFSILNNPEKTNNGIHLKVE